MCLLGTHFIMRKVFWCCAPYIILWSSLHKVHSVIGITNITWMFFSNGQIVANGFTRIWCNNFRQYRSVCIFLRLYLACEFDYFSPLSKNTFHCTVWHTSKSSRCFHQALWVKKLISPSWDSFTFLYRFILQHAKVWIIE